MLHLYMNKKWYFLFVQIFKVHFPAEKEERTIGRDVGLSWMPITLGHWWSSAPPDWS